MHEFEACISGSLFDYNPGTAYLLLRTIVANTSDNEGQNRYALDVRPARRETIISYLLHHREIAV